MTLYSDLGVPPDADHHAIKKAYRSKARATHPDLGGDTASFQAVSHAYEVLSDPARRSHYDKTGDHGQAAADVELQNMLALLAQYVLSAVANAPSVKTVDIRAAVKTHIGAEIAKFMQDQGNAKAQAAKVLEAGRRFKRKQNAAGEDLVHMILDGQTQTITRALTELDAQIAFRKRLVELIDSYSYAVDQATVSAAQYVQCQTYGIR